VRGFSNTLDSWGFGGWPRDVVHGTWHSLIGTWGYMTGDFAGGRKEYARVGSHLD
jgi:hypothetical protein